MKDTRANELIPFVPMAAVAEESGRINLTEVRTAEAVRSGYTRFQPGDVLFAKITPCMENGKIAVVPDFDAPFAAGSTEFHVLSPQRVNAKYLFYWLSQRQFRREAEFNMTGTAGQKRVPPDFLRNARVPVPRHDIQRRIVSRIDELFFEIEDGEEALRRARAALKTHRKSLLKVAVTGELTSDWRDANPSKETGGDLLQRILADRRTRWDSDPRRRGKRYSEPLWCRIGNLPHLPGGWVWVGIEQLTTGAIRNGLSVKGATEPTEIKGLRLDALRPTGIDWARTRYLPIGIEKATPYLLRAGDLLISRANGSPALVGQCSLVADSPDDTIFPDTAIRYPLWGDAPFHAWVQAAWSAPHSRGRVLALAKTTAGILKVSQADIAAVPLPLPPLEEIVQITRRLEELAGEAEAGVDDLAHFERDTATLRQSILAAAFRGELIQ